MKKTLKKSPQYDPSLIDVLEAVQKGFSDMEKRFEQVDNRFEQVDERFEQIDQRFERLEERTRAVEKTIGNMNDTLQAVARAVDADSVSIIDHEKRIVAVEKHLAPA